MPGCVHLCLVSYASLTVLLNIFWLGRNFGSDAVLPCRCNYNLDKRVRVCCAATSTVEGGRRQRNLPALPAGAHPFSQTPPAVVALPPLAVPYGMLYLLLPLYRFL